mgnify:CR=1 FL=1
MIIYPAIDIRGGRCVRLTEGRFDAETVFADDPAEMAAKWAACGAEWLHLVDLDGALAGEGKNLPVLKLGKSQDLKAGQWVVAIQHHMFGVNVRHGVEQLAGQGRAAARWQCVAF